MNQKRYLSSPIPESEIATWRKLFLVIFFLSYVSSVLFSYVIFFCIGSADFINIFYREGGIINFLNNHHFNPLIGLNPNIFYLNISAYLSFIFNTFIFFIIHFILYIKKNLIPGKYEDFDINNSKSIILLIFLNIFFCYAAFFIGLDFDAEYPGSQRIFTTPIFPFISSVCTMISYYLLLLIFVFFTKGFLDVVGGKK